MVNLHLIRITIVRIIMRNFSACLWGFCDTVTPGTFNHIRGNGAPFLNMIPYVKFNAHGARIVQVLYSPFPPRLIFMIHGPKLLLITGKNLLSTTVALLNLQSFCQHCKLFTTVVIPKVQH